MDGPAPSPQTQEIGVAASGRTGLPSQVPAAPEEVVKSLGHGEEAPLAADGDDAGLGSGTQSCLTQAGLVESSPRNLAELFDFTVETQLPSTLLKTPEIQFDNGIDDSQ